MKRPIYLDNHATTPIDPRVFEAMLPYFCEEFGNAASRQHLFGWKAEAALEKARCETAEAIGASPQEIVFTSGATESNNLAIFGILRHEAVGKHIITASTEHRSVLDVCHHLETRGCEVTYLPVDSCGSISLELLEKSIRPQTVLITLMAANNEIGTLHPLTEIGKIAQRHGIPFHSDAAQAAGKIPLHVESMGIDLLSISAHKIYGPKGSGALYVRKKNPTLSLVPLFYGGGHERGLRPGTPNVAGAVGLGLALSLAQAEMPRESLRLSALRDRLYAKICEKLAGVRLNGHATERLPNNLHLSFADISSEAFLMEMREVALSSGSACSSTSSSPSHVLKAIGLERQGLQSGIRYGLGRFTTEEEIDATAEKTIAAVRRLRKLHFSQLSD